MAEPELSREAIFEELKSLLIDLLKTMREKDPEKRPVISWDTDLVDKLGIDSVETLDVLNAIEDRFDINPDIHEANSKRTVGEIVDYIIELKKSKR